MSGCTTKMYKGSSLSPGEKSIIKTQATMISLGYWIWPAIGTIDGTKTSSMEIYDSLRRFKSFEVLPGEHTLSVYVITSHQGTRGTYSRAPTIFKVNTRPNHAYCVKIIKKDDGYWGRPIIIDENTGEKIE